jgi:hypothetical protein
MNCTSLSVRLVPLARAAIQPLIFNEKCSPTHLIRRYI